jgi:hypothetical protein
MLLSAFVTFCEGYLGVWPMMEIWSQFFHFKAQKAQSGNALMECGAALIYTRPKAGFPKITLPESSKRWQDTFLYARNLDPESDMGNLTHFVNVVPTKVNWGYKPPSSNNEVSAMSAAAKLLSVQGTLTGPDLVATFVERWVLPLASRAHKIGLMSGPRDPTRFSTRRPSRAQVIERVNIITNSKLPEGWEYGMEAYTRFRRFPQVKLFSAGCRLLVFVSCFLLMRGSCVQRFNCQKIDAAEGSEDLFLPDLPLSEVEDEDEAEVDEGAQSGGGGDDEDDEEDDDDDDRDA